MLARMIGAPPPPASSEAFTEREYLALESVAERRHEFVARQIVGVGGAEPEHNQIVHNLHVALDLALRARRCRIAGADQRVRIEATGDYVYPDVVVTCAEARYVEPAPRSLTNPELVIEVLSPTTEAFDRGTKWAAYQTVSSLRDYGLCAGVDGAASDRALPTDRGWLGPARVHGRGVGGGGGRAGVGGGCVSDGGGLVTVASLGELDAARRCISPRSRSGRSRRYAPS